MAFNSGGVQTPFIFQVSKNDGTQHHVAVLSVGQAISLINNPGSTLEIVTNEVASRSHTLTIGYDFIRGGFSVESIITNASEGGGAAHPAVDFRALMVGGSGAESSGGNSLVFEYEPNSNPLIEQSMGLRQVGAYTSLQSANVSNVEFSRVVANVPTVAWSGAPTAPFSLTIASGDLIRVAVTRIDDNVQANVVVDGLGSRTNAVVLDLVYNAGFADSIFHTFSSAQAGVFTSPTYSNVATVEYKKNGVVTSLPVSVVAADVLTVTITRTDDELGATVSLAS